MPAVLTRRMSLRDALSVMLDADVITGVVVDDQGRALGVLTVDQVASVSESEWRGRSRSTRR